MEYNRSDRQPSAPRARRAVAETGSFGKSTRRSRSRTGSAPPKREDANMKVADDLFSKFLATGSKLDDDDITTSNNNTASGAAPKRKTSYLSQNITASASSTQDANDGTTSGDQATTSAQQPQPPHFQKEPTEVILRGYASPDQQYAAVNHYEQVAGRICEDYAREPPPGARRYKSELRDPALTRRHPAPTRAERQKVVRVAGGEHWIKVTFESADAADAAVYASPQKILGHLVYAEHWHGLPPKEDAAVVDVVGDAGMLDPATATGAGRSNFGGHGRGGAFRRHPSLGGGGRGGNGNGSGSGGKNWTGGAAPLGAQGTATGLNNGSPQGSQTSTGTLDTATASTATVTGAQVPENGSTSTSTSTGAQNPNNNADSVYCNVIPTARRVKLLPADQAMAPQPSPMQLLLARIPLIGWFSGSMIGNEVPRNEVGEFDLARASLFWRLMFYLDLWFGLFGSDLVSGDKED
ncbi:hypothetical protein UCREL1_1888 [Eutypa lata UCREL1]|uniref:Nucleoporin NUP53 n=1 Tax=Eutypa lata (strain UCR-EL1) TaxID=1287681 RepID=M7T3C6_EUTLA|nr:hypothetical protein UCREL1_1888 [Eutypa lata UCREL1]